MAPESHGVSQAHKGIAARGWSVGLCPVWHNPSWVQHNPTRPLDVRVTYAARRPAGSVTDACTLRSADPSYI